VGKVNTIIIKGWWSTILYQADRFVSWLTTSKQKQPQFLSAKARLSCCAICTCLIFTLVIFSCFGKWNCSYEGIVSRTSMKFRNSPRPSYMWYQKVSVELSAKAEMLDTLCKIIGGTLKGTAETSNKNFLQKFFSPSCNKAACSL
jgi:hypothetical protein